MFDADGAYQARRDAVANLALAGGAPAFIRYTPAEQAVWRQVLQVLEPLHAAYACREFLQAFRLLRLDRQALPQLRSINAQTVPATGFRMQAAAGLIDPRRFLESLGRGIFLSTQFVRDPRWPLEAQEPDVVHELIGHAATLLSPAFTRLQRAFGCAAQRADAARLEQIARLYWYTLELGAVREEGGLKVYGAGLLSSFWKLTRLDSCARLRPFRVEVLLDTPYDPWQEQRTVFVAESFSALSEALLAWLDAPP